MVPSIDRKLTLHQENREKKEVNASIYEFMAILLNLLCSSVHE